MITRELGQIQQTLRTFQQFVDVNRGACASAQEFRDMMESVEVSMDGLRKIAAKITTLDNGLAEVIQAAEEEEAACKTRWDAYKSECKSPETIAQAHDNYQGAHWTTKNVKRAVSRITARVSGLPSSGESASESSSSG